VLTTISHPVRESAKKVQRFLTLGVLHLSGLWFGLLQVFLDEQLTSDDAVYAAIDRTTWRDINLLMASVVWKGRAIPLYWQRLESLGNSHYDEQTAFLSLALPQLADYRVLVLGDREFCSVDLARWLGQQGHYFCLRQKKSTYVLIEDKPWLKLSELGLVPGTKCFYNAVTMTKSKGSGSAYLAGKWKRRYRGFAPEEPWFWLTNLESLDEAVAAYQKRFDIEKMFQMVTDVFSCELNTLGYPRAALFVFCMAVVAFNILSTLKTALKAVHGTGKIEAGLSNFYSSLRLEVRRRPSKRTNTTLNILMFRPLSY